jgi:Uma2 family endonuclease
LTTHRRPDISWFTDEQIDRLTYDSKDVPAFVIEVISTNDQINRVERKMDDYRAAGVQVVWHVFPLLGKVHVYGGEKLSSMHVVAGEQICSAKPVLAGFELRVEELLRKPGLPG